MYAQWICVFMCAAAFAANAAVIPNNNSSTPSLWNHTIIMGSSSPDNILIHTEVISHDSLHFFADDDDIISRLEFIDLDGISKYPPTVYGGVEKNYLFVYPQNETDIRSRFLVNIFKIDYRQMFRGVLNNRSAVILNSTFDNHLSYHGNESITAFHIQALSEESVSTLAVYGGLRNNYLFVQPSISVASKDAGPKFNIVIYAEPAREPNHFHHGEMTSRSRRILDRRVRAFNLNENTFTVFTNNWNVTYVRLSDRTRGYGGRVAEVSVISDERVVHVRFEDHDEIDFDLEVYAEPRTQ